MLKNKILIILVVLVVATAVILIISKIGKSDQIVRYEGYVIRNDESMYFAPNSPTMGNDQEKKIWICNDNLSWESGLKWEVTDNGRVEYSKVQLEGVLSEP